jgi:aminopeptidase N
MPFSLDRTGLRRVRSADVFDRAMSRASASRSRLALCLCLAAVGTAVAELPKGKEDVERLKADVYYLASNTLEGRGISTPGIDLAAQHIRAELKRIGLKSGTPDGSYYQPFEYGRTPKTARTTLRNVIGVLEGKGETANETIVVGAHYDHLGHGEFDSMAPEAIRGGIHPGADDNASGTAAMLELARRFASRGTPPRRRMVFIAFCAEESGQIGSRHYASKAPIFPIKDTVAMINFDMVGRLRNDVLGIAGNESAREFAGILAGADARSPLKLMLGGPEYPDDSDHSSFSNVGVPILYICTGSHEDRHTPTDTADKINYEGLAKVVDLTEDVLDRLLVSPRPAFVPAPRRSSATGSK